ncbi:MAG: pseudouridine synthase [Oligoflexia bacterium]|nr:MAG: pseudouridine synthase [Oligoflexia bacterium]
MANDKSESKSSTRIRLNKLIAQSGLASRRIADKWISEGRVLVNGKKVFELGIQVDAHKDRITVDGKPLKAKPQPIYIMFNKPTGVLTTMYDPFDRPTIQDYVEDLPTRVFPVGRLDWDSEGLLILTNDGDYANRIMHPKEEVTKTYLVKIDGELKPEHYQKLLKGVTIPTGKANAKYVEKIKRGDSKKYTWLKIIIAEGKNRQIRAMMEKIGFDVLKLQRVAIGRLRLGALDRGEMVFMNETAAERVFLPDSPEDVKVKKSYAGRQKSTKKPTSGKKRPLPK